MQSQSQFASETKLDGQNNFRRYRFFSLLSFILRPEKRSSPFPPVCQNFPLDRARSSIEAKHRSPCYKLLHSLSAESRIVSRKSEFLFRAEIDIDVSSHLKTKCDATSAVLDNYQDKRKNWNRHFTARGKWTLSAKLKLFWQQINSWIFRKSTVWSLIVQNWQRNKTCKKLWLAKKLEISKSSSFCIKRFRVILTWYHWSSS